MMALLVVLSLPSLAQRRYDRDPRDFYNIQSSRYSNRGYDRGYDRNYDRSGRGNDRGYRDNYYDDDYGYQNRRSQPRIRVKVEFDNRGNRIPNYNPPHRRGQYNDYYDGRRRSGGRY